MLSPDLTYREDIEDIDKKHEKGRLQPPLFVLLIL